MRWGSPSSVTRTIQSSATPTVRSVASSSRSSAAGRWALVVGLSRSRSFFPDIYNGDWFYLLDAEKGLQPLAVLGEARQRPYDPFRTPGGDSPTSRRVCAATTCERGQPTGSGGSATSRDCRPACHRQLRSSR